MNYYEIEKLKIKNCLNCGVKLCNVDVFCFACYKLNLNTLYKTIKNKVPDNISYTLLKTFVKNEKYNNINTKPKVNVYIEHKKHIVQF